MIPEILMCTFSTKSNQCTFKWCLISSKGNCSLKKPTAVDHSSCLNKFFRRIKSWYLHSIFQTNQIGIWQLYLRILSPNTSLCRSEQLSSKSRDKMLGKAKWFYLESLQTDVLKHHLHSGLIQASFMFGKAGSWREGWLGSDWRLLTSGHQRRSKKS